MPLLIKLAKTYKIYDSPQPSSPVNSHSVPKISDESWRKVHSTPIPRLGGIAIFLGSLLGYLLLFKPGLGSLLIPGAIIFSIGVVDDLWQIPAKWRLLLQIVIALAATILSGLIPSALTLYTGLTLPLPEWLGTILAVFIIVGAINAANMIDGLDGLAAGLALIALLLLSFICYFHFQNFDQILVLSLPLIGATLGFLKYNTHPARMFMGDGGSNYLGYFIGIFILMLICNKTILLDPENQRYLLSQVTPPIVSINKIFVPLPLLTILLAFAVPIFDSACVIGFRLKNQKNPFKADKSHFHHAMLRVGLSHPQSVSAIYFIGFIVGISGLVPIVFVAPKYHFSWVPYAVVFFLLFAIILGRRANKELIDRIKNSRLLLSRSGQDHPSINRIISYWESLNKYLLYAFLAILPLFAGVQKEGIGYAALVSAVLVLVSFFFKGAANDFIDSLLLSIGVCVLLVVNNQNPMSVMFRSQIYNIHFLYNYLFIFLFFSVLLFVIFTMRRRYLEISPTDFLLAGLPLILLLTPEPYRETYRLNIIGLRSLVVFMVLRMFTRRNKQIVHHARVLTLLGLVYVILTSLLGFRIVYL